MISAHCRLAKSALLQSLSIPFLMGNQVKLQFSQVPGYFGSAIVQRYI